MEGSISAIEYQWGMIDKIPDASRLPIKKWTGSEIPKDLLQLIQSNKILHLPGSHGDPESGTPIEYHHLKIFHENGETVIRCFNLAVAMFSSDDEETGRIFRVMAKLMSME